MKKCTTCYSDIEDEALKCIHCSSYQDWRRHITLSSSVLALMVALVSVLGLVVPTIIKTFHTPLTDIKVQVLSCELPPGGNVEIDLLVMNNGDRAGFINKLEMTFVMEDENNNFIENTRLVNTKNELVAHADRKVDSDAFIVVKASFPNYFQFSPHLKWKNIKKYSYDAYITTFSGIEKAIPVSLRRCTSSLTDKIGYEIPY